MPALILTLIFSFTATALANPCPQNLQSKPSNQFLEGGKQKTAVMSYSHAMAYFKEMLSPKYGIPYKYVNDGCDMRAYLISKALKEKYGLDTFRVALEAKNYENLYAKTPYTAEGGVEFPRHTATVMCVKDPSTKQVLPYVFDPSFFDKPVSLAQWQTRFTEKGSIPTKSYFAGMYTLSPERNRSKFISAEIKEAERLRRLFLSAQEKMLKTGIKPYGIGRAKPNLREESHWGIE